MSDPLKKCRYVEKTDAWVTPRGRATFVAIADKWVDKNKKDDDGQFALTLIFPPDVDLGPLKTLAGEKAVAKFGKSAKGIKSPMIPADEKNIKGLDDVDLSGWTMIRANTYKARPTVVKRDGTKVEHEDLAPECYSGRWMCMSVRAHAYDQQGNKGVKFYLGNIQLLDDDEHLGGFAQAKAEDEFEAIGEEAASGDASKMFA